jgi:hypothetical protein
MATPVVVRTSLVDLPGEIKNIIYDIVLRDSNLKLDHKCRDRLRLRQPSPVLDLLNTPTKSALLGTCRAIREEAMPVLAKNTTVQISDSFDRDDPLLILPSVFLSNISTLEIDVNTFVHIARAKLPALKQITLTHKVDGIGILGEALHILHCGNCGGAGVFLREGLRDVSDWDWMKKQISLLAAEESWETKLTLKWECYSPKNSYVVSPVLFRILPFD